MAGRARLSLKRKARSSLVKPRPLVTAYVYIAEKLCSCRRLHWSNTRRQGSKARVHSQLLQIMPQHYKQALRERTG